MASAALELAGLQRFGVDPGRAPALLHETIQVASARPELQVRCLAALARIWAYANEAPRGAAFAEQAIALAEQVGEPQLLADALGAQLAILWGPDDLDQRVAISRRLTDVAAHVDDVPTRLDAQLWRLTTAMETLDMLTAARQLSALDLLAAETDNPTVRYFATTRRAMHAILVDDLTRADELIAQAGKIGDEYDVPDTFAVQHTLTTELARHAADLETLAAEAPVYAEIAIDHGIQSLMAEAAVLHVELDQRERAQQLLRRTVGAGLSTVLRDVDWLMTVAKATEAAALLGELDIAREGVSLLEPFAGRAVLNAGAVVFVGVVEDFLHVAAVALGDARADQWGADALAVYDRLGADWLAARVRARSGAVLAPAPTATARRFTMRPLKGKALWSVGPVDAEQVLPDMRGLRHLHTLLAQPHIDIPSLELVGDGGPTVDESDTGGLLDRRALQDYRRRLKDLDTELAEAHDWNDIARSERLEAEREALLHELKAASGLGGRSRTTGGSAERARVTVRKAIATALERIELLDASTARALRSTIRTGTTCRYEPDPDAPCEWLL